MRIVKDSKAVRISETRSGDISARAGLIITDGLSLLACKPTPSSRWSNPKLDIPKGHIQTGEKPIDAAIRECWEETNIRFEKWKLNRPKQFVMDGEPLYLWEARLSEMPPIEKLSCASTFIDEATGIRHPEMSGYVYITRLDGLQEQLRIYVEAYFNEYAYPFEDGRICADKINIPDGFYTGTQSAYYITLSNGIIFKTISGVKGRNIPIAVVIKNGFIYQE
jgi:8-oxo-dGTP pyrophosphatase MutT (NUDIX family)